MKIIKEGDPERVKRYVQFECKACGCVFEADQSEYNHKGRIYDRIECEFIDYYDCKCPCCEESVAAYTLTKG